MDGYGMAVWIALATGMRKSEILGLQWDCINLDEGYVDVRQTLAERRHAGQDRIQPRAKSKKSIRRIPIDPETVERLRSWRAIQAQYFLSAVGHMPTSESPVCSNEICGFIDQHLFSRWWKEFCVAIGFGKYYDANGNEIPPQQYNERGCPVNQDGRPYSRMNPKPQIKRHYEGLHLHELRHTYATMLIANGVDFKTVQYLMGHASASTTLDLYGHAQESQKRAASDLMGSLLSAREQHNVIAL
jgi:integrase